MPNTTATRSRQSTCDARHSESGPFGKKFIQTPSYIARICAVRKVFEDWKLGDTHKLISHFDDIIQNAGLPLGGDDLRPFFLKEDEDENAPSKLQEEIAVIEDQIKHFVVMIKEGEEQLANWN